MCLFCRHKYKIIQKVAFYSSDKQNELPRYHKLVLECQKCGKIKIKKI